MFHHVFCFLLRIVFVKFTVYCSTCVKSVKSAINVPIAAPFTTVNRNYRHSDIDDSPVEIHSGLVSVPDGLHWRTMLTDLPKCSRSMTFLQCLCSVYIDVCCAWHISLGLSKIKKGQLSYFSELCQILPGHFISVVFPKNCNSMF